jgi:hypothetical protein
MEGYGKVNEKTKATFDLLISDKDPKRLRLCRTAGYASQYLSQI